ncbi:MAG: DUF4390 domain-containing protein [Steroidobacteraceae bacterium]
MTRGFMVAAAALMLVLASGVRADALDGRLEVSAAHVVLANSVYALHARIEYPMTPAIVNALHDGVTLTFELEARITRDRHFWIDPVIADVILRRVLAYHSISGRYVVRDVHSHDLQSFSSLDDALAFLSKVDGWPILVASQLRPGERYHISLRAGIRRGRLPASLRALLFWTSDWHRVSKWYTWKLPS